MSRCWDWCTLSHEHSFAGGAPGLYVRPDTIPASERQKVYEQTGIPFEKRSDMERKLRESGKRVLERGEPGDRMRRDIAEWVRSGGEASGVRAPRMEDYISPTPRRNPLDVRRVFRENYERAKARYSS